MGYGYQSDDELDRSTNRVMAVGALLLLAMAFVFPLYRWVEPSARDTARSDQLASLATEGANIWKFNCASCHGIDGQGAIAPALNSKQFLNHATDAQITLLVSVGIPGTQMNAFSLDHAGPLTSEQIKSVVTYLRTWEKDAPDNPDWRAMIAG